MKMKRCKECSKKLGIMEGYRHPTLGKDSLLCSSCFDIVDESVAKWRNAVLPYVDFFNDGSSNSSLQLNLKNKSTSFFQLQKKSDKVLIVKDA